MSYRKYTIIVVSSDMASCFCKRNGLGHFNIFFYDNFLSCHYNFVNLLFATVSNIYVTDPSMAYKGLQNYVITNKKLSLLFSIMWHPRKLECPTSEFCRSTSQTSCLTSSFFFPCLSCLAIMRSPPTVAIVLLAP